MPCARDQLADPDSPPSTSFDSFSKSRSVCSCRAPCVFLPSNAAPVMSLNGLDDPSVIDAYQTALAEAGGW